MAIIQSGASSDNLTVDPTSKAARVTLYNSSGTEQGTSSAPNIAKIQSGASTDVLTIDATSKAARATQYDSGGTELFPAITGAYMLPIRVRQTATTAAASTVWAMRNVSGPLTVYIRKIKGAIIFDGTAATNTIGYDFMRFTTATPSSGTALTVIKKRTAYASSNVTDARFVDTGLTVTSIVFETPFAQALTPISVTSMVRPFEIDFTENGIRQSGFELASGQGLAIQLTATAVVGLAINGWVEWDER